MAEGPDQVKRLLMIELTRQLETATSQLETGRQVFLTALDLLDDPHTLYLRGNETVRSLLNRAFFTRLYIDGDRVTDHELNEPFNMFHEAYTIYHRHQTERRSRQDGQPHNLLPARCRRKAHEQSSGHHRGV